MWFSLLLVQRVGPVSDDRYARRSTAQTHARLDRRCAPTGLNSRCVGRIYSYGSDVALAVRPLLASGPARGRCDERRGRSPFALLTRLPPQPRRQGGPVDDKVNLAAQLAQFSDHWAPRSVAHLNDYDVMVVKVQGNFVWHQHDETEDFFLVLAGQLTIQMPERAVTLGPGELFVVP